MKELKSSCIWLLLQLLFQAYRWRTLTRLQCFKTLLTEQMHIKREQTNLLEGHIVSVYNQYLILINLIFLIVVPYSFLDKSVQISFLVSVFFSLSKWDIWN